MRLVLVSQLVAHILRPPGWDAVQKFVRQITMRVDDPHAATRQNILHDQIAKKRCLTRADLPYHIGVMAPVLLLQSKWHIMAPRVSYPDVRNVFIHGPSKSLLHMHERLLQLRHDAVASDIRYVGRIARVIET